MSSSQYDCDLETVAVTGNWIVKVNTADGNLYTSITNEIAIASDITSVEPNTDINFLGGDLLTITGDSFGYDITVISVTFTDGTICTVLSADMTEITCEPERWTDEADSDQTLTITINDVEDSMHTLVLID
jgi:hypothetical protein